MRQVNDLCLFKSVYLIYLLNISLEEKLISLGKKLAGGTLVSPQLLLYGPKQGHPLAPKLQCLSLMKDLHLAGPALLRTSLMTVFVTELNSWGSSCILPFTTPRSFFSTINPVQFLLKSSTKNNFHYLCTFKCFALAPFLTGQFSDHLRETDEYEESTRTRRG